MKLFLTLFVLVSFSMVTVAIAADTSDGCGLGWQITDKKTMSATTTRGSTNSVVPNTFGMTSGTIGCEQHSLVKVDKEAIHFAEVNYEVLMIELAYGQGETVDAFAGILGCSSNFAVNAQRSYAEIVPATDSPQQLIANIKQQRVCI